MIVWLFGVPFNSTCMLGSACVFLPKGLFKFIVNLYIESSFQIEDALHIIAILSVSSLEYLYIYLGFFFSNGV